MEFGLCFDLALSVSLLSLLWASVSPSIKQRGWRVRFLRSPLCQAVGGGSLGSAAGLSSATVSGASPDSLLAYPGPLVSGPAAPQLLLGNMRHPGNDVRLYNNFPFSYLQIFFPFDGVINTQLSSH